MRMNKERGEGRTVANDGEEYQRRTEEMGGVRAGKERKRRDRKRSKTEKSRGIPLSHPSLWT